MTLWLRQHYRAVSGFACGLSFSTVSHQIIFGRPLGLILFNLFLTILNGYFAFRPLRGAEDDSGKGCQSERCEG